MMGLSLIILSIAFSEVLSLPLVTSLVGFFLQEISFFNSFLSLLLSSVIIYKWKGSRNAFYFSLCYCFSLFLNFLTSRGVMIIPFTSYYSLSLINNDSWILDAGVILLSIVFLINKHNVQNFLLSYSPKAILRSSMILMCIFFVFVLPFPNIYQVSINDLLDNELFYSNKNVCVQGTLSGNITLKKSSSGNEYESFDICSDVACVLVFKLRSSKANNLSINNLVNVCGVFSLDYAKPEITNITSMS